MKKPTVGQALYMVTTATGAHEWQIAPEINWELVQDNPPSLSSQPLAINISDRGPQRILTPEEQMVIHRALIRSVEIIDDGHFIG